MIDLNSMAWIFIAGMAFITLAALIAGLFTVLIRRDPYRITVGDIAAEGPSARTVRGLFLAAIEAHVKLNKLRDAAAARRWNATEGSDEAETARHARRERRDHADR